MDLVKSSLKIFLARLGGSVISFLGTVYFARELGPALFGTFVLFQALAQMLAVPADFGLQGAVIKRMSERENPSEVLSTAIGMLAISLAIVSVTILLLEGLINSFIGAKAAFYLVAVVILNEIANLTRNALKGELRVGETAHLTFAKQVVFNGLGALLLLAGAGIFALIYALIVSFLLVIIWGGHKLDTSPGKISLDTAQSLLNFSKFSIVAYIDSYLYNWLDETVIGIILAQTAVGTYEVAWRVSAVVMLFSGAVETTILPQISAWDTDGAKKEIENVLPHAITASLFFIIPAFFGALVLSQDILYYLFTPEYANAWPILIILIGGKLFEGIDRIFKNFLSGMDRPDLRAIAVLASISLNILLNFILVWAFGSIGAAIATTLSFAVSTLLIGYYLSRLITIKFPYREVTSCFAVSIFMAVGLIIIQIYISQTSIFTVIGSVVFGVIIYSSMIIFFPTIRGRIVNALQAVIQ